MLYIVQQTIAFHIVIIAKLPSFTIERHNSTNCYKEGTIPSLPIESKLWRKGRFETLKNQEKLKPNLIERLAPTQPRSRPRNKLKWESSWSTNAGAPHSWARWVQQVLDLRNVHGRLFGDNTQSTQIKRCTSTGSHRGRRKQTPKHEDLAQIAAHTLPKIIYKTIGILLPLSIEDSRFLLYSTSASISGCDGLRRADINVVNRNSILETIQCSRRAAATG